MKILIALFLLILTGISNGAESRRVPEYKPFFSDAAEGVAETIKKNRTRKRAIRENRRLVRYEELKNLKWLLDNKVISQAEFEAEKRQILDD